MSVLESLRKRSGLLVGIVGLAILAFILTDFFGGKGSIFGNSDLVVGEIAGNSIDINVFKTKVDEAESAQLRNTQKTT